MSSPLFCRVFPTRLRPAASLKPFWRPCAPEATERPNRMMRQFQAASASSSAPTTLRIGGPLTHADTALYRAKNEGRGTYRFFEASMGAAVRDRRLLEHDLRQAIARQELRLVYQPLWEIPSRKAVGFEALVRWSARPAGRSSRRNSFQSPKTPALFSRLASGCCGRLAARPLRGKSLSPLRSTSPPYKSTTQTSLMWCTSNFVRDRAAAAKA